jgi:hypothetical protein
LVVLAYGHGQIPAESNFHQSAVDVKRIDAVLNVQETVEQRSFLQQTASRAFAAVVNLLSNSVSRVTPVDQLEELWF